MKEIKNFTQWFFFKLGWKWLFWILYPENFFKIGLMGGKRKKYPRIHEKSWVLIIKIRVSAQKPKKIVGIIFKNISYSPKSGKSLGYYFQKQPSQPNQSQSNILKCIRAQSITVQYTEVHSNTINYSQILHSSST